MGEILMKAVNVCKTYQTGAVENKVLDHITVEIYEGDFTVIMGASGAGKSSLLYALSGVDEITSGQVFYKNEKISRYNEKQMSALRSKEFGFVFQQSNLVSNLTLYENVAVAGYLSKEMTEKEVKERADTLLTMMQVDAARHRFPAQASGGEAQRTAIARAMIHKPQLVFADEPTGALNKKNSIEALNLLTQMNASGQSLLMITHDIHAAIRGNRLLYISDGKITGEKLLPPYNALDLKEREEQVSSWLSSLEW